MCVADWVHAKDIYGDTPLHIAAAKGNAAACRILLEHGKENDKSLVPIFAVENESNQSPILLAVSSGDTDTAKLLVEYAIDSGRHGRHYLNDSRISAAAMQFWDPTRKTANEMRANQKEALLQKVSQLLHFACWV